MTNRFLRTLLATLLLVLAAPARSGEVRWLSSEHDAFAQASSSHRYVLLYLEAVWCHWCHVMDHETYADDGVAAAIDAHYVPLRIDQDSRPDLASRYRDFGWPATIVFAPDGTEIVKRRGFIAAPAMRRLLAAIVADPSPEALSRAPAEAPAASGSGITDAVRAELERRHRESYDPERGGLRTAQKYLERDSVEYALVLGASGDENERERATRTLDAARALIDPVWGGVYQYSTGGDWKHPHYEKLGTLQGEYLRVYALAHALGGEARHLDAARDVRRYIAAFLRVPSPCARGTPPPCPGAGGYYTSQDADLRPGEHSQEYFALDDEGRRALGVPRVDRHRYAREAGVIAEALAYLHEATGDEGALAEAAAAARWAVSERSLPGGGFRHDARDSAGPYLADSLAMGRAALQLYRSSGEREWLALASRTGDFIAASFRAPSGFAAATRGASPIAPVAQIDENIQLARFANALARYSGSERHAGIARHALAWLARPDVALSRVTEAGVLLADRELHSDPIHLTVVGSKDDPAAATLFAACLRVPAAYKRLDWWDRSEGPLPNPDVKYPSSRRAAAFVCTDSRCSTPIHAPQDVAAFLAEGGSVRSAGDRRR